MTGKILIVPIDVPTIHPQPVESTYRANKTPNQVDDVVQKKKGKHVARETSSPKPSLKVRIRQQQPSTTNIPSPTDDRERDEIHEAAQLSLALHKTAKSAEEKENVAAVKKKYWRRMWKRLIEPGSYKDKRETIDDDDGEETKDDKKDDDNDDDDHVDHATIKTQGLKVSVSPTPAASTQDHSKPTSCRSKILPGKINETLHSKVPKLTVSTTNDLIKELIPKMVNDVVKQDRESSQDVVPALISQEFATHAPRIIEEFSRIHMQNTVLNVHPTTSASTSTTATFDRRHQLYLNMKTDLQAQGDDAPPEGEKGAKRKKTSKCSKFASRSSSKQSTKKPTSKQQPQLQDLDAWVNTLVFDEDEVIPEDETPEFLNKFQNVNKRVPTIYDHERMDATLRDAMNNQFKDAEEYAYHLEQSHNYMENQIVWESRQEDLKRPMPKALVFYGP
uniref:Uncharacterized protein n=1 Tax=Tanacetum cinerariifolium TaxID=118510 RepID=A0A6L2LYX9_TANCI|nr:hypothetical protein [Tanacetum cinerariifolium]